MCTLRAVFGSLIIAAGAATALLEDQGVRSLGGVRLARDVGDPVSVGAFTVHAFEPFRVGQPYLWLGVAVGVLVAWLTVELVRVDPRV